MSTTPRSSSAVSEGDVLACGLIGVATDLDDLLTEFRDRERCYTLDELANTLDVSTTNAKETFTKNLEAIADRISSTYQHDSPVFLAGVQPEVEGAEENPESSSNQAPKRKEEYIKAFGRVSPLSTSTSVCPDLWLKSRLGSDIDVPILLIEIVSGSEKERSVRKTLLKAMCNTVDLMRLYMTIFDSDVKVTEVSSIVVPKSGSKRICPAVLVTVKWGEVLLDWKFQVSFTPIPIDKVAFECERIVSAQITSLKSHKVNPTGPKFLVRLYDLPTEMKQIPSKNSIVILEKSQSRVLKFTPRLQERNWLNEIRGVQTADSAAVAVKPRDIIRMRGLVFFTYNAVIPPLARARLSACFGDFVLETAKSLQRLHVDEMMAHLDIRTLNMGYTLSAGQDGAPALARAVFIDLDRGTADIDHRVMLRTAGVQCSKPTSWPKGVVFSAKRCDWRQWALMVWSVLAHGADEVRSIYAGRVTESGFAFLDDILAGATLDWDEISEADLLDRIRSWIASEEMERARESRPSLNTTTLVDEVRRPAQGCENSKRGCVASRQSEPQHPPDPFFPFRISWHPLCVFMHG